MEYAIGALSMAAFLLCLFGAYKLGQRARRPVYKEVPEEERRKAERLRKSFEDMMSYDVSTALGRKQVR